MGDGGFGVALDGRPVGTPAGAALRLPTAGLADAIAEEWAAQEKLVRPHSMPMMRLAAAAIDRVGRERDAVVGQIAAYGGSDLLCYRACGPGELVRRQAETWQPLLDWAEEALGAPLAVTTGVTHAAQPPESLSALAARLEAMDDFQIAAQSQLTAACGSLVLSLAAAAGRIGVEETIAASQLDEEWQAEIWGRDKDAEDRRTALAAEITSAIRFLELVRG
ncbi:MAG: ATPase [Rhodospirillales bacterium]|nr:MAG: ATPase [Rhodospirillales bacterium]